MRSLAKQRAWPALAYDGSKQLFAPSRAIEEAHRKDGITIPVHRPADLEGGDPEDVFKVRPGKPRQSVRLSHDAVSDPPRRALRFGRSNRATSNEILTPPPTRPLSQGSH